LPLTIALPPSMRSLSPGPATTRLMKFTSARSRVGRGQIWFAVTSTPHIPGRAVGAARRVEDHDVADLRLAEVVADPVDQHALVDLERRDHRLARDPVRLDQEGLDAQREAQAPRRR
jgi:hypothetical protein